MASDKARRDSARSFILFVCMVVIGAGVAEWQGNLWAGIVSVFVICALAIIVNDAADTIASRMAEKGGQ